MRFSRFGNFGARRAPPRGPRVYISSRQAAPGPLRCYASVTPYVLCCCCTSSESYVLRLLAYVFVFGAGFASSTVVSDFTFFFYAVSRPWGLLLLSSLQASNYSPFGEVGHWVEVDRTVKSVQPPHSLE